MRYMRGFQAIFRQFSGSFQAVFIAQIGVLVFVQVYKITDEGFIKA